MTGTRFVATVAAFAARLYDYLIDSRARILLAALCGFFLAGAFKYTLAGLLVSEGVSRYQMRVQDGLTTGIFVGVLVWIALVFGRFRRRQIRAQIRVVADLNHHLRNALSVILNSHLLPEATQADAILESVERIDKMLQRILAETDGANDELSESARKAGVSRMRAKYSEDAESDSKAS